MTLGCSRDSGWNGLTSAAIGRELKQMTVWGQKRPLQLTHQHATHASAALLFKTVLAVPLQEARMRALRLPDR